MGVRAFTRGGIVDEALDGLGAALVSLFADRPYIIKRVAKLRAHPGVEERHLFLWVHMSGLPFPQTYALMTRVVVPPEPPPLPARITHLWLAPQFGDRVLLGTSAGWESHRLPQ